MQKNHKSEIAISEKTYKGRVNFVNCKQIKKIESSTSLLLHNHVEQNYFIGNKKSLFYHMKRYYQLRKLDVFQVLPLTFHVTKGLEDSQFK
jgi:tubulin monoglycylase TTLL3/8